MQNLHDDDPDQQEPLRGWVDDQGEAEQPRGGGRPAGRRQVHQALRGGRLSLEPAASVHAYDALFLVDELSMFGWDSKIRIVDKNNL